MSKTFVFIAIQIALLAGACAYAAIIRPELPPDMATHFGANGQPNGWIPRDTAIAVCLGIVAVETLLFLALAWLLGKMPASLVNIPNRQYWFDESRRAETVRSLRERVMFFSVVMCAYLIGVFALVWQANLNPPPQLSGKAMIVALAGFGAFVVVWCGGLLWRFRQPAEGIGAELNSDGDELP